MKTREQKALETYYVILNSAFTLGDKEKFASSFTKDTIGIGTTEEEIFRSQEDVRAYFNQMSDQLIGKIDLRNREIKAIPIDDLYLIVEFCDIYLLVKDEWTFVSKGRFSMLFREEEGRFLCVFQHASVPDSGTVPGETIPYQKLMGEFDEMKEQVRKRTIELQNALDELKAMQAQLIQSEKMASLGELTAGIAHEIKNPLNFVNNFADINAELIDEMTEAIEQKDFEEVSELAKDIKTNAEKVRYHGGRADSIVKGMLMHSRASSGEKEPTDINALCDEYLRLSYHGLRAKDKTFNSAFETHFDESLPKIEIIPQEIGRVILNILNNGFYAIDQRRRKEGPDFKPLLTIKTAISPLQGGPRGVTITIFDNGGGIPKDIIDKIFQPFFTTKPTGSGTGLGLSLSYDIVTKGHGGELTVETEEGEGTKLIIILPV